jgi:uncharacterized damage-inducible protein DinB
MAEEFEDRDLSEAVFWGVDLSRATFRDVNLTGASLTHSWLVGTTIDGRVEGLVVNGVDVTAFVNEHDRWWPLRGMLRPDDVAGMRATWVALREAWDGAIGRAAALSEAQRRQSVNGEWSFVDTLRHLQFAIDKWFSAPLLGAASFHPFGRPNSGSVDVPWPGLDPSTDPSFDEVLQVRSARDEQIAAYLEQLDAGDVEREVEVIENGTVTVRECVYVVFEEEFEHLRYALRDLDLIG